MLEKLTENLGLKLLSILVACALWLIVINYDDPVTSTMYSGIPVEIINENVLTDQGKVYEILNGTDTVTVKIEGKRSVIDGLQRDNIRAIADMNLLTQMDTIAIQVSTNKDNDRLDSIFITDNTTLELSVEDLITVHMPVSVVVTGDPADGYVVGDVTQNQNTVRVSGPRSVIERLDHAECYVSTAGRYSDVSASADIRLFDEDGLRVQHSNLSTNISTINVTAAILPVKAVNIEYGFSGSPAEGYAVYGPVQADRTAVYIAGRQTVLDGINNIVIPETEVDISGKKETFVQTLDLTQYLPEGVRIAENAEAYDGTVNITVNIVPKIERTLSLGIEQIELLGVPDTVEAEVLISPGEEDETTELQEDESGAVHLKVRTVGIQQDYAGLDETTLRAVVNVAAYMENNGIQQLGEGIYRMEAMVELPKGIELKEECYVFVRLQTKSETDDGQEEP